MMGGRGHLEASFELLGSSVALLPRKSQEYFSLTRFLDGMFRETRLSHFGVRFVSKMDERVRCKKCRGVFCVRNRHARLVASRERISRRRNEKKNWKRQKHSLLFYFLDLIFIFSHLPEKLYLVYDIEKSSPRGLNSFPQTSPSTFKGFQK